MIFSNESRQIKVSTQEKGCQTLSFDDNFTRRKYKDGAIPHNDKNLS